MAADTELPVQALVTFNVLSWEIQRWSCIYCQYASPLRSLFLDHIQRHAPPKKFKRDKTTSTEDSNYFSRTSSSSSSSSSALPVTPELSAQKDCCFPSIQESDIDVITVKEDGEDACDHTQHTAAINCQKVNSLRHNALHDIRDPSSRNSVIHGNDHDTQGTSSSNAGQQSKHRLKCVNHDAEVQPTDLSKNGLHEISVCANTLSSNSDVAHQRISQTHPNILTRLLNRPAPLAMPNPQKPKLITAEINPSVPLDMTNTTTTTIMTTPKELTKQEAVEELDDMELDEISNNAMTKNAMLSPLLGSRVYRCNVCEYRCDRLDELRRHIRCHTNGTGHQVPLLYSKNNENVKSEHENGFRPKSQEESPPEHGLMCSECGFTTVSKCELESHKLRHSEEEDFECYLCSFRTSALHDLQNHLHERHDQHAVSDIVSKRKQNSTDADEEFSSDEEPEEYAQTLPKRQRLSPSFSSDTGSEYNNKDDHQESVSSPDVKKDLKNAVDCNSKNDGNRHCEPASYRHLIHEAFERNLREYNNNNDIDKSPPKSSSPSENYLKNLQQMRAAADEARERKDHSVSRTDISVPLSVSIAQQQSMMLAGQYFGFPGDPRLASPAFISPTMLRPAFDFTRLPPPTTVGSGLLLPRPPVSPCQASPSNLPQVPSTSSQIPQTLKSSQVHHSLAEEERMLAEKSPRSFNRCRICKFETYNRKLYRDHLQECYKNRLRLGKKMHRCQMCSYMTSRLGNLKRHEWTVHKKPKPPRIRSPRLSLQSSDMTSPSLEEREHN